MSAPLPMSGHNPYTVGYQKRQFGTGKLYPTPNQVVDYLASPPASLVAAKAVNPLEEEADIDITPQPGIVPAG